MADRPLDECEQLTKRRKDGLFRKLIDHRRSILCPLDRLAVAQKPSGTQHAVHLGPQRRDPPAPRTPTAPPAPRRRDPQLPSGAAH